MFPRQTIALTTRGKPAKIHLVSTGAVAVKTKFRESRRTGILAMFDFIFDRKFTEWMPIWVMIIEHPEGVFIIDTGENANVNDPGYFRSSGLIAEWFDTTQFRFKVDEREEIGPQLNELNIPIEKVKAVVLSHLHLDHADGLKYFPDTKIIVNRKEWEKPFGDLPKLYPRRFKPTLVDLDEAYKVFDRVRYLTDSKDILMVETPGHTFHHCSVLFQADECCIFFAADICYTQRQLLEDRYSGTNASHRLAKDTYERVKRFIRDNKTVFIPSHDSEAAARLKELKSISEAEKLIV
jgi:glyoxylase-like metal-dependent hydrolase (beta-lactamase superfamily II)